MSILKFGVCVHWSAAIHPYTYVDGVCLKCSWGGEIQNFSIPVAIGVSNDGFHEIIVAAERRRGKLAFLFCMAERMWLSWSPFDHRR